MLPIIFVIAFTLTLSFFYLRFPIKMWNRLLRPAFGPVVISDKSGMIVSRFMGFVCGAIGIGLLAALILGIIRVRN